MVYTAVLEAVLRGVGSNPTWGTIINLFKLVSNFAHRLFALEIKCQHAYLAGLIIGSLVFIKIIEIVKNAVKLFMMKS